MSVLHLCPNGRALAHAAARALYLPIGAGTMGLLASAAAFVFGKCPRLHR
jgi:hypothetical protein